MGEDEVVAYAKRFVAENVINGRRELHKKNDRLYRVLLSKGLLDAAGLVRKINRRPKGFFKARSDDELLTLTRKKAKENGISTLCELRDLDMGLYRVLNSRKLLNTAGLKKKLRQFRELSDSELIALAKKIMKVNKIQTRGELQKTDNGIYNSLRKRKLLDKVGFSEKRRRERKWRLMTDEELVAFANSFLKTHRVTGRKELNKKDSGLYYALIRRKLLRGIGFAKKKRKERHWRKISDEEIVKIAERFMNGGELRTRADLEKADPPLYEILRKRKILAKIGFVEKRRKERPWSTMNDDEVIAYAIESIRIKGLSKKDLPKADKGLYEVLRKRKLIHLVFSDIERSKQHGSERDRLLALSQAAEAMEKFGERG